MRGHHVQTVYHCHVMKHSLETQNIPQKHTIYQAAELGLIAEVRALVSAGVSPSSREQITGWTPLHFAAKYGHLTLVTFLVEIGVDVSAHEIGQWTPLHAALWNRHADIAKYLIMQGAEIDISDAHGITPRMLARAIFPSELDAFIEAVEERRELNGNVQNLARPLSRDWHF